MPEPWTPRPDARRGCLFLLLMALILLVIYAVITLLILAL